MNMPVSNPNDIEWAGIWMDTSLRAICLKERPDHGDWQGDLMKRKCGRLSTPEVNLGDVHTQKEFEAVIRKHKGECVVIGHDDDKFVWRGDAQDFLEMWMVD